MYLRGNIVRFVNILCVENEDIVELIKSNVKLKIIIERLTNMSFGQSKMS